MAGVLEQLDAQLESLLKDWGVLTTLIALLLAAFLIYPTLTAREADTHPFLLHRQTNVSAVRQPGESAVYRSQNTLHGSPLISGLNVKAPGASKWSGGKNGDLRDVWHRASGQIGEDGNPMAIVGRIFTVQGVGEHIEYNFLELSKQINRLGSYVRQRGATTVAIYLPNSIETLITIFAAAFYGFHPILLPYDQPAETIPQLLQSTKADFLVASAGSLDPNAIRTHCPAVGHVMFVVPPASRHMDFTQAASVQQALWHDHIEIYDEQTPSDLPNDIPTASVPDVTFISPHNTITLTQKNLVSAIAAQIAALPARHRIDMRDTFLAADVFSNPAILVQTLAALFSNANLALHSVAGAAIDLVLAARGASPTIIAASAQAALNLHAATQTRVAGAAKKWALARQMRALQHGYMPGAGRLVAPASAGLPACVRLLYVYSPLAGPPPLSSHTLSQLRAFTGARVVYGLTATAVAGTVAQTGFYDYRVDGAGGHFGAPVGALEIKLVDTQAARTEEGRPPKGEIVVSGPAVVGGTAKLGALGTFGVDGTLAPL